MSRPPLFIHIPKTAGGAIVQSNSALPVSVRYINNKMKSIEEMDPNYVMEIRPIPPFFKHLPYSYLDRSVLGRFDSVFTVVRNPWSRAVSLYNYADRIRALINDKWYNQSKISFEEFLDRRLKFKMTPGFYRAFPYDQWACQSDWVVDGKNYAYKADVLRYENLQEDLTNYLGKKVQIPVVNKGIYEDDYRSYYNEKTANIIADWFKTDIARWGFTFEGPATKNYWTP
jgi:hypothetical protein